LVGIIKPQKGRRPLKSTALSPAGSTFGMLSPVRHLFIGFGNFLFTLLQSRGLILSLTHRDFRSRYLGSYLNFVWAFIQPALTLLILWFVFETGFKSAPVSGFPFILWLMTGLIPWFFFSECWAGATNSIVEYDYLVKKVVFRVSVLPVIKILSSLVVHLFFVAIIFFVFIIYGYRPDFYDLQVFYYLFATLVLVLGLSWMTSSLVVFIRDIGHIVAVLLQFGFWLTPIIWNLEMVPQNLHPLMKLNPAFYITEGYRDAFIHKVWFWEHPYWSIYFWIFTWVTFVVGGVVFAKLRPHFADVI
jgi:lipopolysaccharide transport system permease protein